MLTTYNTFAGFSDGCWSNGGVRSSAFTDEEERWCANNKRNGQTNEPLNVGHIN